VVRDLEPWCSVTEWLAGSQSSTTLGPTPYSLVLNGWLWVQDGTMNSYIPLQCLISLVMSWSVVKAPNGTFGYLLSDLR